MSDFVSDDEIDDMFEQDDIPPPAMPAVAAPPAAAPMAMPAGSLNGLPVYPLALAQVPPASADSMLTRKVGPLPVWGWALTLLGTGIGGYYWWQSSKKVTRNDGEDSSREPQSLGSGDEGGGREEWGPSRSRFADQLNRHFMKKGMSDKVHVYVDAEDAKKKLKHVSPLVNLTCTVSYKPDKELERLCKREGLSPIVHDDGSIGLYPGTGKRGRAWEEYVDLLRDDGQQV